MLVKKNESLESMKLWDSVTKAIYINLTKYDWKYLTSKINCELVVFFWN
jgi:hypothetical protein